jgi:hypothetical protein
MVQKDCSELMTWGTGGGDFKCINLGGAWFSGIFLGDVYLYFKYNNLISYPIAGIEN